MLEIVLWIADATMIFDVLICIGVFYLLGLLFRDYIFKNESRLKHYTIFYEKLLSLNPNILQNQPFWEIYQSSCLAGQKILQMILEKHPQGSAIKQSYRQNNLQVKTNKTLPINTLKFWNEQNLILVFYSSLIYESIKWAILHLKIIKLHEDFSYCYVEFDLSIVIRNI